MPLNALVPEWTTVPDIAEAMDVSVTTVRQWLNEGKLIAIRSAPGEPLRIPADFIQDGEIVKSLVSVLTVLGDKRFTPEEAIDWLFTPDDSLPGTPILALRENRGNEVKRRAQAEL